MNTATIGTVYLIHFDRPIPRDKRGNCQHYLGWTVDLPSREKEHRATYFNRHTAPLLIDGKVQRGVTNGVSLIGIANTEGIGWQIVRTWEGTIHMEKKLKRRHNARRLCPICNPGEHQWLKNAS